MRETSVAYRATLAILDRVHAFCRCASPEPTTARPSRFRPEQVTFCRTCQGLIKPDADSEERATNA